MLAQWQRGMAVIEHMHVLAQAQKVRYRSLLQPFDPGVADELAIACQRSNRLIGERRLEDLHQIDPLGGIGIACLVEDTAEQRDAHIAMSHTQHQQVQIGLVELPVSSTLAILVFKANMENQPINASRWSIESSTDGFFNVTRLGRDIRKYRQTRLLVIISMA